MKTLKRTLCLVLAVVMVLGLGVFSVSAEIKDYPDADAVGKDFEEAMDVLTAIGVINGTGEGKLNPTGTLSRAEGAVLVARLLKYDENKLAGTSSFDDVPDWAQPSVGLLEAYNIVAGNGSGKFNPSDPLTGVQFVKMLLCALEYDPTIENLVGTQWMINTVKLAKTAGLDKDDMIDYVNDETITREQAAKFCLNALKADKVRYTNKGTTVTVNGAEVTTGASTAVPKTETTDGTKYSAINDEGYPWTVQLGEDLYGKDLRRFTVGEEDDFGNPATTWTYKAKKIGSYDKKVDATFTGGVKYGDLYDAMGSAVAEHINTLYFYVDGYYWADYGVDYGTDTIANYLDAFDATAIRRNSKIDIGFKYDADTYTAYNTTTTNVGEIKPTGDGAVTKVFWDYNTGRNGYDVWITVTNYYLAKAISDYNSSRDRLNVDVFADATGPKFTEKGIRAANVSYIDGKDVPEVIGAVDGDFFAVTISHKDGDNKVVDAVPATKVSGATVSAFKNTSNVTLDGTKYDYNQSIAFSTETVGYDLYNGTGNGYKLNSTKYTAYVDPNGYVLGVETDYGTYKAEDYLFVRQATKNGFDYIAKITKMDGTEKTVTVAKVNGDDVVANADALDDTAHTWSDDNYDDAGYLYSHVWYTFTEKSNGEYEFDHIDHNLYEQGMTFSNVAGVKVVRANSTAPLFQSGTSDANAQYNTSLRANNKTVMVADGKLYTGISRIPNVTVKSTGGTADTYYAFWLIENDRALNGPVSETGNLLAIYTSKKGIGSGDDNLFYVYSGVTKMSNSDGKVYYQMEIVDKETGEKSTIDVTEDTGKVRDLGSSVYNVQSFDDNNWADFDNGDKLDGGEKKYFVAENEIAATDSTLAELKGSLLVFNDISNSYPVAINQIKYRNGVMTVGSYGEEHNFDEQTYNLASDAKIYRIVDDGDKEANLISAGELNSLDDGLYNVYLEFKGDDNQTVANAWVVRVEDDTTPLLDEVYEIVYEIIFGTALDED